VYRFAPAYRQRPEGARRIVASPSASVGQWTDRRAKRNSLLGRQESSAEAQQLARTLCHLAASSASCRFSLRRDLSDRPRISVASNSMPGSRSIRSRATQGRLHSPDLTGADRARDRCKHQTKDRHFTTSDSQLRDLPLGFGIIGHHRRVRKCSIRATFGRPVVFSWGIKHR